MFGRAAVEWAIDRSIRQTRIQKWLTYRPDRPFHIFKPQYQDIDEIYVVQERRATDFEAQKLRKSRSGYLMGSEE